MLSGNSDSARPSSMHTSAMSSSWLGRARRSQGRASERFSGTLIPAPIVTERVIDT